MQNSNLDPKLDQNHPKTRFSKNYDFYVFYDFYIKKGSLGAHVDASIYMCVDQLTGALGWGVAGRMS